MTSPIVSPDIIALAAQIAHEANRAYCQSIGDYSQVDWEAAEEWQRESAILGVKGVLDGNTPEQQHELWMQHKIESGWVYSTIKDGGAKTHPCLVPYAELPEAQKRKDHLYLGVVKAVLGAYGTHA